MSKTRIFEAFCITETSQASGFDIRSGLLDKSLKNIRSGEKLCAYVIIEVDELLMTLVLRGGGGVSKSA